MEGVVLAQYTSAKQTIRKPHDAISSPYQPPLPWSAYRYLRDNNYVQGTMSSPGARRQTQPYCTRTQPEAHCLRLCVTRSMILYTIVATIAPYGCLARCPLGICMYCINCVTHCTLTLLPQQTRRRCSHSPGLHPHLPATALHDRLRVCVS